MVLRIVNVFVEMLSLGGALETSAPPKTAPTELKVHPLKKAFLHNTLTILSTLLVLFSYQTLQNTILLDIYIRKNTSHI